MGHIHVIPKGSPNFRIFWHTHRSWTEKDRKMRQIFKGKNETSGLSKERETKKSDNQELEKRER